MLKEQGVISLVGAGGKTSLMFRLAQQLAADGDSVLTTTTTRIFEPTQDQSRCVILSESADSILKLTRDLLKDNLHLTAAAKRSQKEGKLVGLQPGIIGLIASSGLFRWIIVEADGAAGKPLKAPAEHEPLIPEASRWVIGLAGLSGVGKPLNEAWVFRPERFAKIAGISPEDSVTVEAISCALSHQQGIFKNSPTNAIRIVFLNQADVQGGMETGQQIARLLQKRKNPKLNAVIIGQVLSEQPVLKICDISNCEVLDG